MTDKERVEKIRSGEIAVNCSTEEESRQFIEWCHRNDIRWTSNDNDNDTIRTYFYVNKENTCYKFNIASGGLLHSSKNFYVNEGIDVITYKEFMKADKNRVTNLEKYYDELISCYKSPNCYWLEVIKKGNCHEMSCKKCGMDFVHWLNEEYKENKEPITKLTKVQQEILKCLPPCSKISLKNNKINIHKDNLEYFLSKIGVQTIESDCDDKQIKIKDILEKCEVVE